MNNDDDDIQAYVAQRQWIGLTEEEIALYDKRLSGSGVAREIEIKLRERNT